MNYEGNKLLYHLDEVLKLAEQTLTYEKIFDLIGISEILKTMYIETNDLNKEYVDVLFKSVKDFIKQPLYKNLDINEEKDLKFLRSDRDFVSYLKRKISEIKDKLIPRHFKVLEYLLKFEAGKHIPVKDILKETKYDWSSLMFILDDLKNTSKIYDYNGREVILK